MKTNKEIKYIYIYMRVHTHTHIYIYMYINFRKMTSKVLYFTFFIIV